MKIRPQYEATIICQPPFHPLSIGGGEIRVFTVRGDYETVSKALGLPGSDARNQLDRFEESLNADDGNV
jgi:hypothetical protein